MGEIRYRRPKTDHEGNEYKNFTEMCAHYGKAPSSVLLRLSRGWSLKDALITPSKERKAVSRPRTDHKGNKFRSFTEMCKAYGKNHYTVQGRLERGYSIKDALEKPLNKKRILCTDGNKTFPTIAAMAKEMGVPADTLYHRYMRKKDLTKSRSVTDHKGNTYKSVRALCAAYSITTHSYYARLASGQTLEQTLTSPLRKKVNRRKNRK